MTCFKCGKDVPLPKGTFIKHGTVPGTMIVRHFFCCVECLQAHKKIPIDRTAK